MNELRAHATELQIAHLVAARNAQVLLTLATLILTITLPVNPTLLILSVSLALALTVAQTIRLSLSLSLSLAYPLTLTQTLTHPNPDPHPNLTLTLSRRGRACGRSGRRRRSRVPAACGSRPGGSSAHYVGRVEDRAALGLATDGPARHRKKVGKR